MESVIDDSQAVRPAEAAPVTSVDRALHIIELLGAAGPDGAPLGTLAELAGVSKPTAHRLLRALMHRGFAEQSDADRSYRLGARPIAVIDGFFREENLPALFRPVLTRVSELAAELVHLGVLDASRVLYLDKIEPDRAIRVWSMVGRHVPAATSAMGRALIASSGATDEDLHRFIPGPQDNPVHALAYDVLRRSIAETRERGYAVESEENESGVACVGVALERGTGRPVAVSITGPVERMTAARVDELGALLRTTFADAPGGFRPVAR